MYCVWCFLGPFLFSSNGAIYDEYLWEKQPENRFDIVEINVKNCCLLFENLVKALYKPLKSMCMMCIQTFKQRSGPDQSDQGTSSEAARSTSVEELEVAAPQIAAMWPFWGPSKGFRD